ncbi:MAG: hypothetical protein NUV94_07840 [Candidatus Acetothermia bacterium]|jgi:hypothetical protein|nr:hypothetical protein [Candidatus Acetothermia bacterium]
MKRALIAMMLVGVLATVALGYEGVIGFQGGHGAKALGMGGAFCALADDGTAALWNPAGIALMGEQAWLGGATSELFGMVGYQYIAGGFSFAGYAVGIGWADLTAGELYAANAYLGTVGVKVGDFGTVGVNLKYYSETVDDDTATGFGFDVGALLPLTPEIAIGIVAKDVGGTTLAGQTVTPLYAAGMALKLLDGALKLAADVELGGMDFAVRDLRTGLEFVLIENLAVRAGVVVPEMDFTGYYFAVGAGFSLAGLAIDAAYVLMPNPGESLVLSATFTFGELFAPPAPTE